MARIYTRTGDSGETSLGDGSRVPKSAARIDAYGDLDELSAVLGCARAAIGDARTPVGLDELLGLVQSALLNLGAALADPSATEVENGFDAARLEELIDRYEQPLPPLKNFILPGGTVVASFLHLARTVCRRAERKAVALAADEPVPAEILTFLNRLSDFLFTAARAANRAAGMKDVPWHGGS
ncbi:MAG: cob(I)yrinic acid a,c-diamide adenosyltransferase [bacterium]|nr:cob(I)yrinic acid a,c-diamide adenosyltransferase [bacterium]